MKDLERYRQLTDMMNKEPFAFSYTISDSHFNFLMRKFEENVKLKEQNRLLRDTNRSLEDQNDRIQGILGTDTFV